jgi:hypothetical protein
MKKHNAILIILSLAFSLYSCEKDSPTKPTPEKEISKLEGNWINDHTDFDMYAGVTLITSYTEKSKANGQATFNTDGTGIFSADGNEKTKFNYIVTNGTLRFTNVEYSGFSSNYKWLAVKDFEYTDVKLGVNELTYTQTGSVAQPALYTNYVARAHLIK